MTSLWTLLDGLPLGPVALFVLGYLVFLIAVLVGFHRGREPELCDRCGGEWETTRSGNAFHVCTPPRRRRAA